MQALKVMQERADDAVPTQVARALIAIEKGEAENAAQIFQELLDKYGQSVLLLNGLAVSFLHQGEFEKAERVLQDALLLVCIISVQKAHLSRTTNLSPLG
jgi:Flp pilus assembly protein TadD